MSQSHIEHLAMECTNRYCSQHRDLWRYYEDIITGGNTPERVTELVKDNGPRIDTQRFPPAANTASSEAPKLTYEQEVHALLYAAASNTQSLLDYLQAQAATEKGDAKKLTQKCIDWKTDDLKRIRNLIPEALSRREPTASTKHAEIATPAGPQSVQEPREFAEKWVADHQPKPLKCIHCDYEQPSAFCTMASGAVWLQSQCPKSPTGNHAYQITVSTAYGYREQQVDELANALASYSKQSQPPKINIIGVGYRPDGEPDTLWDSEEREYRRYIPAEHSQRESQPQPGAEQLSPKEFRLQWSHKPTPIPQNSTGLWYSEECADQLMAEFLSAHSSNANLKQSVDGSRSHWKSRAEKAEAELAARDSSDGAEREQRKVMRIHPCVSAIGPFAFDHHKKTVTLGLGTYTLKSPITFGMLEETEIKNLDYVAPTPHTSGETEEK